MKTPAEFCSDERLRFLLESEEENAEYEAAASHLETCERCQTRLSEFAAGVREWEEACQLLEVGEVDAAFARERLDRSHNSSNHTSDRDTKSASWTEAMARQLLAPPSHPEMLGRLGRYEIERLIGAGGMGVVFKGFDTELNRPVAIKVLAPNLAHSGAARQRFAREARAAAAVVHEHVVAIHNVESEGAAPFLVMQFVAGESLQSRLDRQGPLEIREVLRIACQTAAGLAAAHAQGLVHRDVKPSNILLEQGVERAMLTDFGLARASDDAALTHTGHLPGTPHYMSPEQARGDLIDTRSDLFSLGSVLYAMCTGRPPFRSESSLGVLRRITDTEPRPIREVNSDIPHWLAAIISQLHDKSPGNRLGSARELALLLESCLAHVQQPTAVPLPEACRTTDSTFRSRFAIAASRLPGLRAMRANLRQTPLPWLAGVVCLVLACGAIIANWRATTEVSGPTEPQAPSSSSKREVPSITASNAIELDTGWNNAEREVDDLLRDGGESLPLIERPWVREPLESLDTSGTQSLPPHVEESNE